MAINDLYKCVINTTQPGSISQNVIYWLETAEDGTQTAIDIITTDMLGVMLPRLGDVLADSGTIECLQIQRVLPVPVGAVQEFQVGLAGQRTGEMLPATNAMLVQKINQAVGGKGKKGRFYAAPISESDQNEGRITNVLFAAAVPFQESLSTIITGLDGGAYAPAWAVRDPLTPFGIIGTELITDTSILPRIATQRRRRTQIKLLVP